MKIVSIVGSLRQNSWNHKLTRVATDILKSKGVEVEEASLGGLTLFNGDLDDGTFPRNLWRPCVAPCKAPTACCLPVPSTITPYRQ